MSTAVRSEGSLAILRKNTESAAWRTTLVNAFPTFGFVETTDARAAQPFVGGGATGEASSDVTMGDREDGVPLPFFSKNIELALFVSFGVPGIAPLGDCAAMTVTDLQANQLPFGGVSVEEWPQSPLVLALLRLKQALWVKIHLVRYFLA